MKGKKKLAVAVTAISIAGLGGGTAASAAQAQNEVLQPTTTQTTFCAKSGVCIGTPSASVNFSASGAVTDAHGKIRGAATDLIDDAGKVVSEAGRHGDAELRRRLGYRGEHGVHWIEADGSNADADLARASVRLRDLSQLSTSGPPNLS